MFSSIKHTYDLIIIGGGAAGLTAAKFAKGLGKKVAIIESKKLGGECTWTGCVPSKTIINSAKVAYHMTHAQTFGIAKPTESIDTTQVMVHVQAIVKEVNKSYTPEIIRSLGIDVLFGFPSFIDSHTITLNDKHISAQKFVIATGSAPFVPPINGIDRTPYLTNETIFNLSTLPQSLAILGGGPIGVELASALQRLGVHVTIIEKSNRILPREDEELVTMLTQKMHDESINIKTGLQATQVLSQNNNILITCKNEHNTTSTITAEQLLIAVGRRPNIQGLSLENAGVNYTQKGIIVDHHLKTTASHIYACGDVVGPYQFSHMAWYQAVVATRNALIPVFKQKVDYNQRIWVTFSAPELATAGLMEHEARALYGDSIRVYRKPYSDLDRAHTDRELTGMAKIICDKRNKILGMHILGARAGDIIHELQIAKTKKITFDSLHNIIHAYPTYAELIWHMSKKAYVTRLENSFWVRIAKKLFFKQ